MMCAVAFYSLFSSKGRQNDGDETATIITTTTSTMLLIILPSFSMRRSETEFSRFNRDQTVFCGKFRQAKRGVSCRDVGVVTAE